MDWGTAPARGRRQHLRHAQNRADTVGQIVVLGRQHAVEQRHGGRLLAARVEQEAQLRSGEQIVRRTLGQDAKLGFGLAFPAHS